MARNEGCTEKGRIFRMLYDVFLPRDFSQHMAELIWDGKYDSHGNKRAPVRIELPFQTVETVNESAQERQRTLELSASGHDPEWRNRLIWGDKKYVLPSLLPEFRRQGGFDLH